MAMNPQVAMRVIVLLLLPWLAGCQQIHEPWVTDARQFAGDRTLPPGVDRELRERVVLYQRDR